MCVNLSRCSGGNSIQVHTRQDTVFCVKVRISITVPFTTQCCENEKAISPFSVRHFISAGSDNKYVRMVVLDI